MIDLNSDYEVLVATIDGETESEPLIGKQAVAASIMNRVALSSEHPHFGDGTVRGACLAHEQFDCWMPGSDRDRIEDLDFSVPSLALQACINTALAALDGSLVDPTGGATHYYDPTIPAPQWVRGAVFCGRFGSQLFYKGVR